ncbi:uncharacterized protein FA14DRAFT_186198 [Meira miltonrushii]|uniref:Uncharacterized protein n=1 Tax=Meira miltonrushii TaxID=1280837 RepID=A0A316V252_9BASI|nr:uncharacterized protein FA14DRAFT_186198 [Meira miltonrushii]PWN31637.1 hypothetical protein FA14DRAFT_186198 [Meira miltonrushii]
MSYSSEVAKYILYLKSKDIIFSPNKPNWVNNHLTLYFRLKSWPDGFKENAFKSKTICAPCKHINNCRQAANASQFECILSPGFDACAFCIMVNRQDECLTKKQIAMEMSKQDFHPNQAVPKYTSDKSEREETDKSFYKAINAKKRKREADLKSCLKTTKVSSDQRPYFDRQIRKKARFHNDGPVLRRSDETTNAQCGFIEVIEASALKVQDGAGANSVANCLTELSKAPLSELDENGEANRAESDLADSERVSLPEMQEIGEVNRVPGSFVDSEQTAVPESEPHESSICVFV